MSAGRLITDLARLITLDSLNSALVVKVRTYAEYPRCFCHQHDAANGRNERACDRDERFPRL
jgi:hypothetical protein